MELPELPRLQTLVLNNCSLPWALVNHVVRHFHGLVELSLSSNGYVTVDLDLESTARGTTTAKENTPLLLKTLRLDGNQISEWREVHKLHTLPLVCLVLSANPLQSIDIKRIVQRQRPLEDSNGVKPASGSGTAASGAGAEAGGIGFASLRSLYVSDTPLASWSDIDSIAQLPALRDLRATGLPLLMDIPPLLLPKPLDDGYAPFAPEEVGRGLTQVECLTSTARDEALGRQQGQQGQQGQEGQQGRQGQQGQQGQRGQQGRQGQQSEQGLVEHVLTDEERRLLLIARIPNVATPLAEPAGSGSGPLPQPEPRLCAGSDSDDSSCNAGGRVARDKAGVCNTGGGGENGGGDENGGSGHGRTARGTAASTVASRRGQTIGSETCGLLNRSAISDSQQRDAEKFLVWYVEEQQQQRQRRRRWVAQHGGAINEATEDQDGGLRGVERDWRYQQIVQQLQARERGV
jgi:hypothetical protein